MAKFDHESEWQRGQTYLEQQEWEAARSVGDLMSRHGHHGHATYFWEQADLGQAEQNHDYLMDSKINQHLEEVTN